LQGIFTPEDCVPEFPGDNLSHQTWNFIAMDDSALTLTPAAADAVACQAACAASADCAYFVFKGVNSHCFLRDTVPYSLVNVSDTSKSYILLEVRRPRRALLFNASVHVLRSCTRLPYGCSCLQLGARNTCR
jgi:hypothetical protein